MAVGKDLYGENGKGMPFLPLKAQELSIRVGLVCFFSQSSQSLHLIELCICFEVLCKLEALVL